MVNNLWCVLTKLSDLTWHSHLVPVLLPHLEIRTPYWNAGSKRLEWWEQTHHYQSKMESIDQFDSLTHSNHTIHIGMNISNTLLNQYAFQWHIWRVKTWIPYEIVPGNQKLKLEISLSFWLNLKWTFFSEFFLLVTTWMIVYSQSLTSYLLYYKWFSIKCQCK